MFLDMKPAHPSEPQKFAMRLLREQFDEQNQMSHGNLYKSVGASKGVSDLNNHDLASQGQALVSYRVKRELKAKDATLILKKEIKGS